MRPFSAATLWAGAFEPPGRCCAACQGGKPWLRDAPCPGGSKAPARGRWIGSQVLIWRYLTFVWLFDDIPPCACTLQRAAIVRGNRERGLRFLPLYMLRYLRMLAALVGLGTASDAMAAPLISGACFTLSTVVLIALMLAGIGFAAMRLRVFDHARW